MITLWWISIALELAVAARILVSRLLKDLPAFFGFVLFSAASDLLLAALWSKKHEYEIAWSIIEVLTVAVYIMVALELYFAYDRLYKPDPANKRLLVGCLIGSALVGFIMLQFEPKADARTTFILVLTYIWCTFVLWWVTAFIVLFGISFYLVSIKPAPNLTLHARLLATYFAIRVCGQILVDASVHHTRAASIVRITGSILCFGGWAVLLRRGGFERHKPNPKIAEAARVACERILSEISDPAGRKSFHTSGED
ncbi:MAG TPA: hypothetical protein VMF91_06405 [Bryobacteraceae bacterium]|nr:hypothetical protein [Bryobacteraceae bacterium]